MWSSHIIGSGCSVVLAGIFFFAAVKPTYALLDAKRSVVTRFHDEFGAIILAHDLRKGVIVAANEAANKRTVVVRHTWDAYNLGEQCSMVHEKVSKR